VPCLLQSSTLALLCRGPWKPTRAPTTPLPMSRHPGVARRFISLGMIWTIATHSRPWRPTFSSASPDGCTLASPALLGDRSTPTTGEHDVAGVLMAQTTFYLVRRLAMLSQLPLPVCVLCSTKLEDSSVWKTRVHHIFGCLARFSNFSSRWVIGSLLQILISANTDYSCQVVSHMNSVASRQG
jgi:hypothetical protein